MFHLVYMLLHDFVFQGRQGQIGLKGWKGHVGLPGHEVKIPVSMMQVFTKLQGCILQHVHDVLNK